MKIDLTKLKKIAENKQTATFEHPDGHQVQVAKGKLDPKVKKQLSKLALHKKDGGMIDDPEADPVPVSNSYGEPPNRSPASADRTPSSFMSDAGDWIHDKAKALDFGGQNSPMMQAFQGVKDFGSHLLGVPNADGSVTAPPVTSQSTSPSNYNLGAQPQAAKQPPMPDPYAGYGAGLNNAAKMYGQGVDQQAQAEGDFGNKAAAAQANYQDQLKQHQIETQATFDKLGQERQAVLNDYQSGHIDPNHYMASRTTGQKVGQAIGLMLAGIGAGMLHQENPMIKFLQSQIDNDIQAQKADMASKGERSKTLLAANTAQFGNAKDAEMMTRMNMHDMMMSQVDAAAAQSKSPEAQARANQLKAEMQMKMAPMQMEIAQRQAAMRMMNQANQSGDPASRIHMMVMTGQLKPEQADKALAELGKHEDFQKQKSSIMNAWDKAASENTVANRALHLGAGSPSIAATQNLVMPYLKDAEGRINETELERNNSILPSPGDADYKHDVKRDAFQKFLDEKGSTPYLDSLGIKVPNTAGKTRSVNVGNGYKAAK